MITAGIASLDTPQEHTEGDEGSEDDKEDGWVDPVTRGPEGSASLEEAPPGEDEFVSANTASTGTGAAEVEEEPEPERDPDEMTVAAKDDRLGGPDPNFTFRLRSAPKKELDGTETAVHSPGHKPIPSFQRPPSPTSILNNPITPSPPPPPKTVEPSPKRPSGTRLLANPISTSLLDPSVPAPASNADSSLFRKPSPRPLRQPTTPFHLQKTLILDLDETLIHSTSRPIHYPGGSSGGGGLLGLSVGGVFGNGRAKEGHTVEVVVNGRSTMYHVYKRPYVDHFLKKVWLFPLHVFSFLYYNTDNAVGRVLVHTCDLYRLHA